MRRHRVAHLAPALGVLLLSASALAAVTARRPTPAPAARPASSANLLVNPGFEESLPGHSWMPAGWDTTVSFVPSVFFGRDTMLAHGRGYAVSVVNVSTVTPTNHGWVQSLIIPPAWWGKDVVFSIWSRSNGVNGRAFVRVAAFRDTISKMARVWKVRHTDAENRLHLQGVNDPNLELGWKVLNFSDEETDWVRREVRIHVAPSTNWLTVSAGLIGSGEILFDDASLTLQPRAADPPIPLNTNLLEDGGFEGTGDAWEHSYAPYEGFRIERDSTEVHGGRFSIRYQGGTGGMVKMNAGVCQSFMNRNLAGKHIRLSGWVRTDSLADEAYLMVFFKTVHGTDHPIPDERVWGNTPWKLTRVEADVPPDTYEVWAWAVLHSPSDGRIWWDDLKLEVTGPAKAPAKAVAATRKARS